MSGLRSTYDTFNPQLEQPKYCADLLSHARLQENNNSQLLHSQANWQLMVSECCWGVKLQFEMWATWRRKWRSDGSLLRWNHHLLGSTIKPRMSTPIHSFQFLLQCRHCIPHPIGPRLGASTNIPSFPHGIGILAHSTPIMLILAIEHHVY